MGRKKIQDVQKVVVCSIIFLFLILFNWIGISRYARVTENDGWEVSSPEKEGMDKDLLVRMNKHLKKTKVQSLVVVRNQKIVWEYYQRPYYQWKYFWLFSVTKSFTGSLVGLALEDGLIQSVDQKISDYFPELKEPGVDPRKKEITIRHLLTHTIGMNWSFGKIVDEFNKRRDPVAYVLSRPMDDAPGERFCYNAGGSHLLSAIIQKATGEKAADYAQRRLFDPLGIKHVKWKDRKGGCSNGGEGLFLNARDMAKFGCLFADQGRWKGKQILPAEWVKVSTTKQAGHPKYSYGYQWWVSEDPRIGNYYIAKGALGKRIYVFPRFQLVVAIIADFDYGFENPAGDIVTDYILNAINEVPLNLSSKEFTIHWWIEKY